MKYDLAVIGGGPAGMMAAGHAGELGARVVLLEKNRSLGIKLLMAGKGRCNITNKTEDPKELAAVYGKSGKFLLSALSRFGVDDVINFFESRGVKTKVERGNRVFPISDKGRDVLDVLIDYLKESKVEVKFGSAVKEIIVGVDGSQPKKIEKILLHNGGEITADKFIIATGGKSYPTSGSSGDAYSWLAKLGHTIITPRPALTPVIVKENFIKELEGLSLKNVEISLFENNKKIFSEFGEALFTNNGLSGPIVIDMSKKIGEELPKKIIIKIDFKPALDFVKLDERILRDFQESNNKLFRNSLDKLLPQKLIPVIIRLSKINPDKRVNLITKEERRNLVHLLKEFSLEVVDLVGFEKAIVTTGGVDLREVDPKTMQSKIIDNLYLAGEVLNIDGPTGGYNLQVCWTTGHVAGENVNNE